MKTHRYSAWVHEVESDDGVWPVLTAEADSLRTALLAGNVAAVQSAMALIYAYVELCSTTKTRREKAVRAIAELKEGL